MPLGDQSHMDEQSLGCPSCGVALDERELVSKSLTVDDCPKCGATVRKTEGFGSTNLAAMIAGDVGAIDSWLDTYSTDTSHDIVKRESNSTNDIRWAIGSQYSVAIECVYDEQKTGFVLIRAVTKNECARMLQKSEQLSGVAARFGVQPCGERHSGWNIADGSSGDGYWGMVQYLNINTLSTALLDSVTKRLNDGIETANAELLPENEA